MKNIFLFLSASLILWGCKKTIDALPEPTQSGANTFGVKLNGEYWVPQSFAGINVPILKAQISGANQNDLIIDAQNFALEPKESQFQLFIKNITGPGTYPFNQNTDIGAGSSVSYAYYVKRKINPLNEWITSSQHTGSVTITKWAPENGVASGTFEFTAGSMDNSADPIQVTEGRFDVKF